MKLIRPIAVTEAVLAASSVPESEPVHSLATTYDLGDVVRGTGDTAHRAFESLQDGNLNHPLTDADWWLETGATNTWRMFDGSVQSQTTQADAVQVELVSTSRLDSAAAFNVDGASAQVTLVDPVEGVVYNREINLVDDSGVTDWYLFFTEPVERKTEFVVTDLPPLFVGATLAVTVSDPGAVAKIGALVPGLSRHLGGTKWGVSIGIQDYSVKSVDDFGNVGVTERAYSNIGGFDIVVATNFVDRLKNILAGYRATPIVYVGAAEFGSTLLYGYYKDFNIDLAYPDVSFGSLQVESLT